MSNRPSNWWDMSYEEQREWKKQDDARQSLEWERDRAREDAERAEDRAKRIKAEYRNELESCQDSYSQLYQDHQELRGEYAELNTFFEQDEQKIKMLEGRLDAANRLLAGIMMVFDRSNGRNLYPSIYMEVKNFLGGQDESQIGTEHK